MHPFKDSVNTVTSVRDFLLLRHALTEQSRLRLHPGLRAKLIRSFTEDLKGHKGMVQKCAAADIPM